jgi:hypothetical protein
MINKDYLEFYKNYSIYIQKTNEIKILYENEINRLNNIILKNTIYINILKKK